VAWKKSVKTGRAISIVLLLLSASFLPLFSQGSVKADRQFSSSYVINFKDPQFSMVEMNNSSFVQVFIPDCVVTDEIGSAQLPLYAAHIAIPDGYIIENIQIAEKQFTDYSQVISEHLLLPSQQETPFSEEKNNHVFSHNHSWYQQDDFQPKESHNELSISYMNGYPVQTIQVFPVRYHPQNRQLYFYGKLKVTVTYTVDEELFSEKSHRFLRKDQHDAQRVKELVLNDEMVDSYIGDSGGDVKMSITSSNDGETVLLGDSYPGGLCDAEDTYEYVIITSESLADIQDQAYNWSDLLDHRLQYDGLTGTIVSVEDIYQCEAYWNDTALFNDSAAQVREFVKDAYLDWDTDYVLLGGSWQTSGIDYENRQIVPARIFTSYAGNNSVTTMASDLYFSNLDGDWYHQYDEEEDWHEWGGGQNGNNDGLSELAVGRIPLWTAEHVSNWIEKVIWYDNCDDADWLRSAAFLGGYLGDYSITSKDNMEAIRKGDDFYSEYTGFEEWNDAHLEFEIDTSHRYYEADYPGDDGTGPGSRHEAAVDDWEAAINNNNFSMISHLGHGSRLSTLNLIDGRYLSNDYYFIGTSQACHSGRFTSGECGAMTFTSKWNDRGGAFAMVLNTAYGFFSPSTTSGASQYQHKVWWHYFFNETAENQEDWQLGRAMQYTKDTFYPLITTSWSRQYTWYSWNLFGDPAQKLRITIEENNIPSTSSPNPVAAAVDVSVNITQLSVFISDADEDTLNWTIETIPDIGNSSGTDDSNGTKICSISNLSFDTVYSWFVNVSDGHQSISNRFEFTTRSAHIPDCPTGFGSTVLNRTSILLNWTRNNSAVSTRVERNTDSSWSRGQGTLVYNGSEESIVDTDLSAGTTFYYRAWSFNSSDNVFSTSFASTQNTTEINHPVVFSSVTPANNSVDCSVNLTFSIGMNDSDGDEFNWSIELNNSDGTSSTEDGNGTKNLILTNLSYNTTFTVWVNATDGFDWTKAWYQFTTDLPPDNEQPEFLSITINPSNPRDTDSSIGWENLTCEVRDNYEVSTVNATVTFPDASTSTLPLIQVSGSNVWFVNTSFSQSGNYTMTFYAKDSSGNQNSSWIVSFSLAPNWDINNDGCCNLLDLTALSSAYGSEGPEGWIREDVDNNGKINVLDLTIVSNHYEDGWWI